MSLVALSTASVYPEASAHAFTYAKSLGYDAAKVLADAMKRAGKTDGPALRDAIAQTKGFPGVTGTITLGPDRNPIGKKLVVVEVKNGEVTLKATIEPESAPGAAAPTATATSGTH